MYLMGYMDSIPSILQWRHNERDGVSNHQPQYCLLVYPFVQAQIKENINAPSHWPLWGEFTGDRESMCSGSNPANIVRNE